MDVVQSSLEITQGALTRYRLASYAPDILVTVPKNASGTIPVSWTAATVLPSVPALDALITYDVERTADGGATWEDATGTCASVAAPDTSCDDAPGGDGTLGYRVTAVFRTWTAPSAISSTSVKFVGGLVAPTFTARGKLGCWRHWSVHGCSGR